MERTESICSTNRLFKSQSVVSSKYKDLSDNTGPFHLKGDLRIVTLFFTIFSIFNVIEIREL